ncbi:MAG: 30S ribosomal protein S7 [Gloeomargarita sp. DG02_4_bins_56]
MSRRRRVKRRPVGADPQYNSRLVNILVSHILKRGKKNLAYRLVYQALETIQERTGNDPIETLEKAVRNATPLVEVKARRVGGATYQVPVEVRSDRGTALAMRWLTHYSRQRHGKTMAIKLANELMDAANETGASIKKREETHRMAESNKAFAHYRY